MKLLSIDPSSNLTGLAFFQDGELIRAVTLIASGTTWTERFSSLTSQTRSLLETSQVSGHLEIAIERIPTVAHPGIGLAGGAVLAGAGLAGVIANVTKESFISPSSWKALARKAGDSDRSPKGVSALDYVLPGSGVRDEDAADAVLIGLAYLARKKPPVAVRVKETYF